MALCRTFGIQKDAKIIFEAGVLEHGDMQKTFLGWCKEGSCKTKCIKLVFYWVSYMYICTFSS